MIGAECIPLAGLVHPDLRIPVEAPVHVLIEASSSGPVELKRLLLDFLASASEDGLLVDAAVAESGAHAKSFWAIREGLVEGQARRGFHVRTDLSVPLSGIPGLVDQARKLIASRYPVWTSLAYGHAGDGNIHFNVLPPPNMDGAQARAQGTEIEKALYDLVTGQGGSISAEHGIGRSRRDYWWASVSPVHRHLLQAVKSALDPQGVMNPGCLVPEFEEAR